MLTHGLSSALLAALLSSTPSAKAPALSSAPAGTEVEIELVEHGSRRSTVGFVVPVQGELEAWVNRSSDPRRCKVEIDQVRVGFRVRLECNGGVHQTLRMEVSRGLPLGKRVRIAEVTRAGGSKSEVFAKLR